VIFLVEENFEKIQNESFYASPPYSYRPSVAEYLSTMHISCRGIIADLMHLDKKGKINIEAYEKDGLVIALKENSDLNDSELFLWNFVMQKIRFAEVSSKNAFIHNASLTTAELGFDSKDKGKTCKITFAEMNSFLAYYENLVLSKIEWKYGSKLPTKLPKGVFGYLAYGFIFSTLLSVASSFISMPLLIIISILLSSFSLGAVNSPQNGIIIMGFYLVYFLLVLFSPFIVLVYLARKKLAKSKLEKKFLFKEIFVDYSKLTIGYLIFAMLLGLLIFIPLLSFAYVIALIIYYYKFGKLGYKFLFWLFETSDSSDNRTEWLKFKNFIFDNSALAEKPLKYYELWGEFYYYALAVGAIKKFD